MAFIESFTKAGWLLLKALRKQDGFRWKLYESKMAFVERFTKAGWLSLKDLRKQDGFRWKVYESRMAFVERSTKARLLSLKGLRKQDGFRWKLYERPIAFIESSSNAGWLSLKALWKPFKKHANSDNTKFRDKIAYVGAPSFRRRLWPFDERCSRAGVTFATLLPITTTGTESLL